MQRRQNIEFLTLCFNFLVLANRGARSLAKGGQRIKNTNDDEKGLLILEDSLAMIAVFDILFLTHLVV